MFTPAENLPNGTTVLTEQLIFGWLAGCFFFQIGKKEQIHSGRHSTWEGVTEGARVSFQIAIA